VNADWEVEIFGNSEIGLELRIARRDADVLVRDFSEYSETSRSVESSQRVRR